MDFYLSWKELAFGYEDLRLTFAQKKAIRIQFFQYFGIGLFAALKWKE